MGEFAAKQGDRIEGDDTHMEADPAKLPPIPPTPVSGHKFKGEIMSGLSSDVFIEGKPAAVEGSGADNSPRHTLQMFKSGIFSPEPKNEGEVTMGSPTVFINGKAAARNNDTATTCNDPPVENTGMVVVDFSSVSMG